MCSSLCRSRLHLAGTPGANSTCHPGKSLTMINGRPFSWAQGLQETYSSVHAEALLMKQAGSRLALRQWPMLAHLAALRVLERLAANLGIEHGCLSCQGAMHRLGFAARIAMPIMMIEWWPMVPFRLMATTLGKRCVAEAPAWGSLMGSSTQHTTMMYQTQTPGNLHLKRGVVHIGRQLQAPEGT